MTKKRNLWIFVGIVIVISALVSGFMLMQPTAEDILIQTLETRATISDVHGVVAIDVDTIEKTASATVEGWARPAEDGPGSFRLEVLETSEEKARGAVVVSDGQTVWAYTPAENKVFVGTHEEAKALMEEKEFDRGDHDRGDFDPPENAEEAVQMLLEYFEAQRAGTEVVANEPAYLLKLEPIPDQMPAEYAAVGGYLNLWIGTQSNLPLALAYTGGSFGEISATVLNLDVNTGLSDDLFSFEVPSGAEVVTLADLEPQSLSLEEAAGATEFEFLTPTETPPGATLVDILDLKGTIAQRYTLPDGGSFTVAQGLTDKSPEPSTQAQTVEVGGFEGQLFVSEDNEQLLLAWSDGELFYFVAGDLSADQALKIAESLE